MKLSANKSLHCIDHEIVCNRNFFGCFTPGRSPQGLNLTSLQKILTKNHMKRSPSECGLPNDHLGRLTSVTLVLLIKNKLGSAQVPKFSKFPSQAKFPSARIATLFPALLFFAMLTSIEKKERFFKFR